MTGDLLTFLERFRPDGCITFVGIVPDGSTVAETFNGADPRKAASWLMSQNRARNVYFTVNPTLPGIRRKPTKDDITAIAAMWGDVDPLDGSGRSWDVERKRLLALADELVALEWPPSLIIDSGSGIQPIWCLSERIEATPEISRRGRGTVRSDRGRARRQGHPQRRPPAARPGHPQFPEHQEARPRPRRDPGAAPTRDMAALRLA